MICGRNRTISQHADAVGTTFIISGNITPTPEPGLCFLCIWAVRINRDVALFHIARFSSTRLNDAGTPAKTEHLARRVEPVVCNIRLVAETQRTHGALFEWILRRTEKKKKQTLASHAFADVSAAER